MPDIKQLGATSALLVGLVEFQIRGFRLAN